MGAERIPTLITVEEYERIPPPEDGWYELHHGELIHVTRPVRRHYDLQRRLRDLLKPTCEARGYLIDIEYAYRPLPDNEVWGADVAAVLLERHERVDKWLLGSPELVIEVKSPSNRRVVDKAMTTLAGEGAVEFWFVDQNGQTVTVYSKLSGTRVYSGRDILSPAITGLALCAAADLF